MFGSGLVFGALAHHNMLRPLRSSDFDYLVIGFTAEHINHGSCIIVKFFTFKMLSYFCHTLVHTATHKSNLSIPGQCIHLLVRQHLYRDTGSLKHFHNGLKHDSLLLGHYAH